MNMTKMWMGTAPDLCDLCNECITETFVDGKTTINNGSWGILCPTCHMKYGCGLGLGCGQQYELFDTQWIKTKG
jgi:hypothetical protein